MQLLRIHLRESKGKCFLFSCWMGLVESSKFKSTKQAIIFSTWVPLKKEWIAIEFSFNSRTVIFDKLIFLTMAKRLTRGEKKILSAGDAWSLTRLAIQSLTMLNNTAEDCLSWAYDYRTDAGKCARANKTID